MNRFFISADNISNNELTITQKEQVRHIRDVLCLNPGEKVEAVDEKCNEYIAVLIEIKADSLVFEIKNKKEPVQSGISDITVACAIPKKVKLDDIVDKLTQLGVSRIIPMLTERVIVKLDKQKKVDRLARWKKIALSASQQSRRNCLLIVEPVTCFKDILSGADKYDLKLIPTLDGKRKSLKDVFKPRARVLILIGPEGDFTPEEVNLAVSFGCVPVSLGSTVLRVDTAAFAAVSFLRLYESN